MTPYKSKSRPYIPNYGISKQKGGLLDWKFVEEQMKISQQYWLGTTNQDGNPHAIPVWGIWLKNKLFFGGGPETKTRKNLVFNPNIVAHTESGFKVVIIYGKVHFEQDKTIEKELMKLYKEKYKIDHPPPFLRIDEQKVIAWSMEDYENTPTRWIIND